MKILMFGWEFPPHITGGLGTACFGMTKGLMKNDVEVLFVVPKAYGDESQEAVRIINASEIAIDIKRYEHLEFWKNITYLEVNSTLVPYVGPEAFEYLVNKMEANEEVHEDSIFNANYTFSGKYGSSLLEEVSRYSLVGAQIATEHDFDIIHAHDWLTYPAGVAAKQASGKPLVVHMHATEFDRSGENINTRVFDIERQGMEAADRVIAVSNLTRNIVIDRYGIDPAKVYTVHNAVDPNDQLEYQTYEKHIKEKVVTFLGRVTFQKGPEYFIEAAYKVFQRDKNVRFVMAGTGDLLEKMIKHVARRRMSSRFHFTGFLRGDNVDHMFALSDVYVMPSVSEPFGISPLEAMRSNVPVVISKQSGVAEILQHALKVDFWDIDAMADAIYALLHYKNLSKSFSKYGATEVDNLKWENAARHIKTIYQQIYKA